MLLSPYNYYRMLLSPYNYYRMLLSPYNYFRMLLSPYNYNPQPREDYDPSIERQSSASPQTIATPASPEEPGGRLHHHRHRHHYHQQHQYRHHRHDDNPYKYLSFHHCHPNHDHYLPFSRLPILR